jgi:hypothetical protein
VSKVTFDMKLGLASMVLVEGALFVLLLLYRSAAALYIPEQWSGPSSMLLSLPFGQTGRDHAQLAFNNE